MSEKFDQSLTKKDQQSLASDIHYSLKSSECQTKNDNHNLQKKVTIGDFATNDQTDEINIFESASEELIKLRNEIGTSTEAQIKKNIAKLVTDLAKEKKKIEKKKPVSYKEYSRLKQELETLKLKLDNAILNPARKELFESNLESSEFESNNLLTPEDKKSYEETIKKLNQSLNETKSKLEHKHQVRKVVFVRSLVKYKKRLGFGNQYPFLFAIRFNFFRTPKTSSSNF